MKKRWPALLLAVLLALSGCGDGGGTAPETGQTEESGGETPRSFRMTQESSVRNEKFREREEFADFIARGESRLLIPGLNQAMTPQGIAYSEATGLVYITSYAITDTPSAISCLSLETGELAAEYYLFNGDGSPFTSHVGGIAAAGNRLYLSAKLDSDGSYSAAVLDLAALPASGSHDVTVEETIPLPVSPSFLNYSQGTLWVGNFYHPSADYGLPPEIPYTTAGDGGEYGCYILGYRLGEEGLTVPEGERWPVPDVALAAPDKIQGVVCLEDSVMLSQSYGRRNNSALLTYALAAETPPDTSLDIGGHTVPAYILDSRRLLESLTAMPMTEGLCLSPEGVLVLFESGSSRYSDGKYRTDRVWALRTA